MKIKKFNESVTDKLSWIENDTESGKLYSSDRRAEFSIYKENGQWVLKYTDTDTVNPESFFVTVKSLHRTDAYSIDSLKKYAQKVYDEYKDVVRPPIEF